MDLTLSLIPWVSMGAESSPSMGTCSVVKGLGLEWTQMEQETVWGHWNKVECPLTSICSANMGSVNYILCLLFIKNISGT